MANNNRKQIKKRKALKERNAPVQPQQRIISGKQKWIIAGISLILAILLLWGGSKLMELA